MKKSVFDPTWEIIDIGKMEEQESLALRVKLAYSGVYLKKYMFTMSKRVIKIGTPIWKQAKVLGFGHEIIFPLLVLLWG